MDSTCSPPNHATELPWTAMSRAVLATLYAGLKDEVAARQVAVSLRTYRRRVADLMDYFSVDTRFELGVRVAEMGILPATAKSWSSCTSYCAGTPVIRAPGLRSSSVEGMPVMS